MAYNAGIRVIGEKEYRETGSCEQWQFVHWIKRAAWWAGKIGKKCFVDFSQKPHTFEVEPSGKSHFLTPENDPIDPAAALLETGD